MLTRLQIPHQKENMTFWQFSNDGALQSNSSEDIDRKIVHNYIQFSIAPQKNI
jgi:hypothetical protein